MGRAIDLIYDKLTHRNFRRLTLLVSATKQPHA
jgi:hypothetical protein